MRITIVQGAFFPVPPVRGGAVEKIWFALGREFAARGHQVTHISQKDPTLPDGEILDGVKHVRIPGFDTPRSMLRLKWRDLIYSRRALRVLPESDVIVTNTFWMPIIAPQLKRGKIYVHIARYPKGQMKFYQRAARLQVVSTVVGDAVCREVPELAERVRVIPNFVPQVKPDGDPARENSVLYVGRVHPEKGLHLLVAAFAKLQEMGCGDWKLKIVGPWEVRDGGGGAGYLQDLKLKTSGLGERVEWIDPVFDAERLNAHYRSSRVFVYPSLAERGETFGLAPLEAMAAGCPPIVSSLECFKDFVKPEQNGWIFDHRTKDNAGALAEALKRVTSVSDAALARIRESAIQTAQEYSLSKIANQYLIDFEEVVAT